VFARVGLGLVLLLGAGLACEGKPGDEGPRGEGVAVQGPGVAAAPLEGKTIDGEPFSLAELHGKVVLVNVWATWCAPCREELPELVRLHHAHRDRGFTVVGVSVDARRAFGPLRAMVEQFALDYPIVFDPDQKAVAPWEIRGYPTSFLVDREGIVRWRRDGLIRPDDDELGAAITAALAGS